MFNTRKRRKLEDLHQFSFVLNTSLFGLFAESYFLDLVAFVLLSPSWS